MDKWIQRSSLFLKELTPLCLISTLFSGAAIWLSSFQGRAITLSQSYSSKDAKTGQKSQQRDTSDGDENETRDKIQISFGKKKSQLLQNIKSNLLELETSNH